MPTAILVIAFFLLSINTKQSGFFYEEIGGNTPLHIASAHNNLAAIKSLLLEKANVNAKNEFGWTAFHNAVLQVNLELVKYLLSQGADKNIRTLDGKTALELANESYPSFGKTQDKLDIISLLKSEQ